MAVFERLIEIFKSGKARFRVIEHKPESQSERVASVRGTTASQGAKAIVCRILVDGRDRLVLAIVPGNRRVDMKAVAAAVGGRKGSFGSVAVAEAVTGCVMGAIPPMAFDDQLTVVADETFLATESEIAFNAGRLDRSIVIDTADYKRIVAPRIKQIAVG